MGKNDTLITRLRNCLMKMPSVLHVSRWKETSKQLNGHLQGGAQQRRTDEPTPSVHQVPNDLRADSGLYRL